MDVYNQLPVFAQNMACYIEGMKIKRMRYGRNFKEKLAEYESHKAWTHEQICEYRDKKLQSMIEHCYRTVPYYKRMFCEYGINPVEIKRIEDLKKLPVLNKQIVKDNPKDFVSILADKRKIKIHATSGTTGAPLLFYTTWEEEAEQWAVWWRYRRNLGIKFDMICGQFGGKAIVPQSQLNPPYWRDNKPCNQVYFSPNHINQKTWQYYYQYIKDNNIRWLHGYPSVLYLLGKNMLREGVSLNLDYVTTGAENLTDYWREVIKEAFLSSSSEVFQHYGLTEGVANISENKEQRFIIDDDFSIVEFERFDETRKKIIGSTLTNYTMPLLRYDTGDLVIAEIKGDKEYIKSFDGRTADLLNLPNGRIISGAVFNLVVKDIEGIQECQIVKLKDKEKIQVNIVKTSEYSEKSEQRLKRNLALYCGDISIIVKTVTSIPRTKSGKMRLVLEEDEDR